MTIILSAVALFALLTTSTYIPFCTAPIEPKMPPGATHVSIAELWNQTDVLQSDLFNGPWGPTHAPDPKATYTFVKQKTAGVSPGMTVRDEAGTEWSVKQGEEGPIEVVLSRVLSGIGYHQPPVYSLPAFTLREEGGAPHQEKGGRFRRHVKSLKEAGEWSFQQNPFVGTKPLQGLLVVLLMFNSSDLKNNNNSLYELAEPREGAPRWYVVRDLGTALGETARLDPKRGDPAIFERLTFIKSVHDGNVEFDYHGWHQELFRDRMTVDDVRWAGELLGSLSGEQWSDAFRAAGFDSAVAQRYIHRLKEKTEEARRGVAVVPTRAR